ncbi:MAG: zinc ribbon domain-containing protein [Robiginitomaculum sp.]|nr:zinc ribbon domain-containing protein [Robiginitomaculum sp.]
MIKLQVCKNCQSVHYPKRDICPACWQDALEWQSVSPAGRVSSFTDLHMSVKPEWAGKLPLRLGLVKLEAGPNVLAFLGTNIISNASVVLTDKDGVFTAKEKE